MAQGCVKHNACCSPACASRAARALAAGHAARVGARGGMGMQAAVPAVAASRSLRRLHMYEGL